MHRRVFLATSLKYYARRCRQRQFTTESFEARPSPGVRESPLPLMFVRGSGSDWDSATSYFASQGYSGLVLSLRDDVGSIDEAVDYLESVKAQHGLVPPVMITTGVSSFVAQKYLESYSLAGLVMVNLVPPHGFVPMLKRLRPSAVDASDRRLIDYLLTHEGNSALKLEKKSVPMLLVSLKGAFAVGEEDLAITSAYHGIDEQHIERLSDGMGTQVWLHRVIHAWIDDFV